jgi:hypothetical protein
MDPITLATIVATLIATKAIEKVGEKIGERGIQEGGKLLDVLRRKAPETANRLAAVVDPNTIDAEIVEEVKRVAAADPEVKSAVDATAAALLLQPGGMTNFNFGKAANVGVVLTQYNTF